MNWASKKIIVGIFISGFLTSSFAEYRTWKDRSGNSIDAEFVSMASGRVVLRNRAKKILKIPKIKLSEADLKYLATKIPPKIDLKFSKKQVRRLATEYWDESDVKLTCKVEITKKSKMQYDGELKAYLVAIGKDIRSKHYIILTKDSTSFYFKGPAKFVMEGSSFTMHEDRDLKTGTNYSGFLVVVKDADGNVIAIKSSRGEFKKNYKKILKMGKGTRFSRKFKEF